MPDLTELQKADIKWAIEDLAKRAPAYKLYDDYYRGEQKSLALASPEFNSAISFVNGFCENLCATVVDVLKDRLKLTNFTHDQKVEEVNDDLEVEQKDPTADEITDIWQENRMDELQGEVYLETLKSGDGYCFVWPDEAGIPRIDPNQAWLVTVMYSETKRGQIDKAAKQWKANDGYGRLNLYYPDRIEKFKSKSKVSDFDGSLNPAIYEFIGQMPNPYDQVPVFHFRNNAGVGKFGVSELKAAIPCQDRLNKTIIDSLVVGEELSLPVRYALGFETPTDPVTHLPTMPFKPGEWWISRQKDAKLGQLDGAPLAQFIDTATDARLAIARVTRTPLHYFLHHTGTPPSGEALKTEEAPLTAKVRDRQITFGNTWEDLYRFAMQIAETKDIRLEAIWANTEPRDDTAEIENQIRKVEGLGFSKKAALRELEYNDDEITTMEEEKADETESAGIVAGREFNAGVV